MGAIRQVEVFPVKVGLKTSFKIGTGFVGDATSAGDHLFVKITTDGGVVGWGEQRALPSWSYETIASMVTTIRDYIAPILVGADPFQVNQIHHQISQTLKPAVSNGHPFALAAVDIALHDLIGRMLNVPIHVLLGGKRQSKIPLCYALSIDTPVVMALQAQALDPCRHFKVKVGGEPGADEARLRAVAEAVPDAQLWIDANQSYVPSQAIDLLRRITDLQQVKVFEQPVPSPDWFGLKRVRENTHIPIAVDEGCFSSYDLAKIVQLECVDAVVLKVCKSGGLRQCLKTAHLAEAHSIELFGSGLTEAGIGFIASVHLFSTLDLVFPPELNAPVFLDHLVTTTSLTIDQAVVEVPDTAGLGIRPDLDYISAHSFQL